MVGWRRATASPTQSASPLKFSVAISHPIGDNGGPLHSKRPPAPYDNTALERRDKADRKQARHLLRAK